LDDYAAQADPAAEAEFLRARVAEAEARLALERDWATRHPAEYAEWCRISLLLTFSYDFGGGESYDFPRFLAEVGPRPSANHVVKRKDEDSSYGQGNLRWHKQAGQRPADSPYMTVREAADYCRRAPKTLLNHHCAGKIRSMPGSRPPLFRCEDLDHWLSTRRKARKK
jgi:hypothetical protein